MEQTSQIQKRAFLTATIILFSLLIITGILTYFIPAGTYENGVFEYTELDNLPFWRIFSAPVEVLWSDGNVIVIAIIAFLLIIGGSINVLREANIIEHILNQIITHFHNNKYLLLALITLVFMSIGAFVGVFEEIVPLVPIMILLSIKLGWDKLIGLGMSVLATGFGFSAAVTNPFTIGVAQSIVGLPVFSGIFYRLIIFIIVYVVLYVFIYLHAKKVDQNPVLDAVFKMDYIKPKKAALIWTSIWFSLMFISIILSPFITFLQDINLILIAFYFLMMGMGVALISFNSASKGLKTYLNGSFDMAPGVLLILLATGIKHIITITGVMDTILFTLVTSLESASKGIIIIGGFVFTLFTNFFIGSGSAKAFIIMPILDPLLKATDISSQLGVLAFQLGDGFSNMFYPTNAVLLVSLGLASMSYTKWFKWTLKLQAIIILLSIIFLLLGLIGGY